MTHHRLTKDARKKQIVQAALSVFTLKGYAQATTLEIAKEANIAEITLFRNFKTKEEIFHACIDPILFDSLKDDLDQINQSSSVENLQSYLVKRIHYLILNKEVIKLILNEKNLHENDHNFIERMVLTLKTPLVKMNPNLDSTLMVRLLLGSFLSFLYLPSLSHQEVENYASKLVSIFIA